MAIQTTAASIATFLLVLLICFQLALAAGLPLGQVAWGGQHKVLPMNLRRGSLAAAALLGIATWIVLARASLVEPGPAPLAVGIATWIFGGYMVLNTLGNLASKNPLERRIMTPLTIVLAVCFFLVAWAPS